MREGSGVKGPKREWNGYRLRGVPDLCGWGGRRKDERMQLSSLEKE